MIIAPEISPDPGRRLSATDVLVPVLDRIGDLRSGRARLCYVHAVPRLGATLLVRTWLAQRGLESSTTWVDLTDGSALPVTHEPGSRLLVIEGAVGSPETLDMRELLRHHEHVIVIGTGASHSWRADWGADLYSADVLRLSEGDVHAVAEGRRLRLTPEALRQVHDQTGGWPTLVDLVLGAYRAGDHVDDSDLGLREARPQVGARLTDSLPVDLRNLVGLMAVADELAVEELDDQGTEAVSAAVDLRRLGLATFAEGGRWSSYRLLGLVADAALAGLSDETVRGARIQLAERRQRLGVLDYGLGLAYQAQAWRLVSRIIDRWGLEISFSTQGRFLQRLIWEIPHEALIASPGTWHRAEFAGVLRLGKAPVHIPPVDGLSRLVERGGAPIALKRAMIAMIARRVHHRYDDAADLARRGASLARKTVSPRHDRIAGATAHWFLHAGITQELAGQFDEAVVSYRLGWQARRHDATGFAGLDLAGKMAAQAAWRGDTPEASDWLREEPRDLDADTWFGTHVASGFQQAAALLADDRLDYAAAQPRLLDLRRPATTDEYWAWRLSALVHHRLTWGEAQQARDEVLAAKRLRAEVLAADGVHGMVVHALEADTALALGRGAQARRALLSIEGSIFAGPLAARLALLTGDLESAATQAAVSLRRSLWRRHRTQILLVQAVAALALDDESLARSAAAQAATQVRAARDLRALCTVPRRPLEQLAGRLPELAALLEDVDRLGGLPIYPDQIDLVELTARQTAVLERLVWGRSLRETADELFVSVNTIKTQTRLLYRVLGVSDRPGLVDEAVRLGLVENGGETSTPN